MCWIFFTRLEHLKCCFHISLWGITTTALTTLFEVFLFLWLGMKHLPTEHLLPDLNPPVTETDLYQGDAACIYCTAVCTDTQGRHCIAQAFLCSTKTTMQPEPLAQETLHLECETCAQSPVI